MIQETQDRKVIELISKKLIRVCTKTGRVFSTRRDRDRPLGTVTGKGYVRSEIKVAGERIVFMNHRAVWLAEHGLPLFGELEIDHLDMDKTNNRISNLQAVPSAENFRRAVEAGVFEGRARDERGRYT